MNLNSEVLHGLKTILSSSEIQEVIRLAKETHNLEAKWKRRLDKKQQEAVDLIVKAIENGERPKDAWENLDMESFFIRHFLDVSARGIESTGMKAPDSVVTSMAKKKEVANIPRIPSSSNGIRRIWDAWKKKKNLPPQIRRQVMILKHVYLDRVQSVWEEHSEAFRSGDAVTRETIISNVKKEMGSPFSRGATIVQTETTRYYNKVRRDIYDESQDITHYLFVAIRDHATTKWCKSRTGLVYKKGDPLLNEETPPIHWNCRSELLPLTPLVSGQLRLINDPTKARRFHKCEPLPRGWNAA